MTQAPGGEQDLPARRTLERLLRRAEAAMLVNLTATMMSARWGQNTGLRQIDAFKR